MKLYKFRAYDRLANKIIYFTFPDLYGYEGEVCGVILPDKITTLVEEGKGLNTSLDITQFTGLVDSNGKEIYGGDIVLCGDGGEYFPQEYDEEQDDYFDVGKYVIQYGGEVGDYPAFDLKGNPVEDTNGLSYVKAMGTIKVIGNIYENPDISVTVAR